MKKEGQGSFIFYYFGWIHNCFFFSFFFGMPDIRWEDSLPYLLFLL